MEEEIKSLGNKLANLDNSITDLNELNKKSAEEKV